MNDDSLGWAIQQKAFGKRSSNGTKGFDPEAPFLFLKFKMIISTKALLQKFKSLPLSSYLASFAFLPGASGFFL